MSRRIVSLTLVGAFVLAAGIAPGSGANGVHRRVHTLRFLYRSHSGVLRPAYLVLPPWYGPRRDPPIPLVISPHGRGVTPKANARLWGDLPARGGFAVINSGGEGRRLALYSWGAPGEIRDLARMPLLAERAFPWLRIAHDRLYAFGESMGGQEVLLVLAQHPRLLAGAASFDAPTRMALRYRQFEGLPRAPLLRRRARIEIGGTPETDGQAYRLRSPLDFVDEITRAGVPLQIWWSRSDHTVVDQDAQSGLLYRKLEEANPTAPLAELVGRWPTAGQWEIGRAHV